MIAEDRTWFYLLRSSAITIAGSQTIADDRRSVFPYEVCFHMKCVSMRSCAIIWKPAFNEGAEIEYQCEFCQHPDADSTMEDVSLPDPPPAETSLEDLAAEPNLLPQQPPETAYHLVQEGTIRGKTKLVTNTGYTYNIRKRRPNGTIDWQCTVRRKDHRCKASVIQIQSTRS